MDSNNTVLLEDPFEDQHQAYLTLMNVVIATHIVKLILGLSVIFVNILLIYIISKFKRLKTTVNYYIRHFAISNIIYIITENLTHIYHYEECLDTKVIGSSLLVMFLFAFVLGFDWLVMIFKPETGLKIKHWYKFITPTIYVLACVKFLILSVLCFTRLFMDTDSCLLLGAYILILLFVIILDFLNFRYKNMITSTKVVSSLTVANIIVLSWLPLCFCHFYFVAIDDIEIGHIMLYLTFISGWISYCPSIFIIIALVNVDKNFRMALAKLFRRSVRHYSNDEDNLDESEDIETDPNVFYHNATTCVKL